VNLDDTREAVLTPKQVAALFAVAADTVAGWADSGKLPSFRTPSGQRRFRREDVDEFLAITSGSDSGTAGAA
jgi:excisionase family DNA binding protein